MSRHTAAFKKTSRIAALVAIAPCSILLAAACGGSDYIDSAIDGSPDGARSDGSSLDGASRDGTLPRDGALPDARRPDAGEGDADADAAQADADSGQPDADASPDADAALDGSPDADADAMQTDVPKLRTASAFAVLGGQTVTNTGPTTIFGNLGVSPGLALTGIPVGQPVGGTTHVGADGVAVQAQLDLTTLYDDLAARPCPAANVLTGQDLAGKTLMPGVYCFATSAALGVGTLTLDANNDPNAFWVFQIGSTLDVAASTVTVINGGTACNVFWQIGSSATVLNNAAFAGNMVAFSSITLNTGAIVAPGRALARNAAVTMASNAVSKAACP
jgi:hypothetical protein